MQSRLSCESQFTLMLVCISFLLVHGDDPNGYGLANLHWTSVHKHLQCFVGDANARQHSTYEIQVPRVDMPCRQIPCSGAVKVPTVSGYIFLVVAAGIMTDWALEKHHQLKQELDGIRPIQTSSDDGKQL